MDYRRRAIIGGGIVALGGLLAAVAWFGVLRNDDAAPKRPGMAEDDPASIAADAFAAAWVKGTLDKVPATKASGNLKNATLAITMGLGQPVGLAPKDAVVTSIEQVPASGAVTTKRVTAALHLTWQLDAKRLWSYDSKVDLVEQRAVPGAEPAWLVDWKPAVVHPRLVAGDEFKVVRLVAKRGEILGPDGQPLVGLRAVVEVGIQPGATSDRAAVARQVAGIVGVDADALVDRVTKAGAGDFVSVITLRQEAFDDVSASLHSIGGVVFREDEIPLAPTRDFARALIGTIGPATLETVQASGGRVGLGEYTGLSGLQASQDEVLSGRAGLSIRVVAKDASRPAYVLKEFATQPGKPITITIDAKVQQAADEVMRSAPKPAALVAIRASTGDVLAVSNGPAGADGYNRALVGKYPPGSTFKVASGFTLLQHGVRPDTVVNCPATIVVGKEFRNAEGEVLGQVPFRKDFADSCNTAFVGQSRTITAQQLADTAGQLGYRQLAIGVPVFGGSVPVATTETEHAADMIGQGKVEASPFAVALASASVASGRSVNPRLVIDPEHPDPVLGKPLPLQAVADLRELMRGVVTNGTGSAVAGIAGGDVFGKTGTAEFGTDDPPQTHAWFTGYQGDIAFAVLVEGGGFGGQVSAPLAAQFLTALAQG